MRSCGRARDLFGAYWDDEVTQAEREWLEAHFQTCAACRGEYEQFARTLEAVGTLPRVEAAPDLAPRALEAARRAGRAPDVIFVRETPRWVPVTAAAAAVVLVVAMVSPYLARTPAGLTAGGGSPVPQARLVATRAADGAPGGRGSLASSGAATTATLDSLFDHSEDVDFVLDPVSVREGRARTVSQVPGGIQGEQTVITF